MSTVPIADLASGMLGHLSADKTIVVLQAYFDDSGTHGKSPWVVLGGLLGTEDQWTVFERTWNELLAQPLPGKPRLSRFHLSSCLAQRDEFASYSSDEVECVVARFNSVILNVGFVTIAAAVNKAVWDELVVGPIKDELGAPEGLAFVKCLEAVVHTVRFRKPGQKVALVFDQGIIGRFLELARIYYSQSALYPELVGIGYGKVIDLPPLQGADIIATGSFQYAKEWQAQGPEAVAKTYFAPYIKRGLSTGLVLDREHIEEMVSRVRETLASRGQSS